MVGKRLEQRVGEQQRAVEIDRQQDAGIARVRIPSAGVVRGSAFVGWPT